MLWCVRGKAEEFRGLHVATGISRSAERDKDFSPPLSPSFLLRKEGQKNLNFYVLFSHMKGKLGV